MIYFIIIVDTCILNNIAQTKVYDRPVSICRQFVDKLSSTDRLAIVGRLTPDDRATFGRYHDDKTSAD